MSKRRKLTEGKKNIIAGFEVYTKCGIVPNHPSLCGCAFFLIFLTFLFFLQYRYLKFKPQLPFSIYVSYLKAKDPILLLFITISTFSVLTVGNLHICLCPTVFPEYTSIVPLP